MMYIQLTENYHDYDKVIVRDVHFSNISGSERLSFRYEICKKSGSEYIRLFDKTVSIDEQNEIDSIASIIPDTGLSIWDMICKVLLQYILTNNLEDGTLETE